MEKFWEIIIKPILEASHPNSIIEIGTDQGNSTRKLAEYCQQHQAKLHVIDPFPKYDTQLWKQEYGDTIDFYFNLSLNGIPLIDDYQIVLIDGDHNWYTVYHELKLIEKKAIDQHIPFPIVILHDVGWPYGRRDLYYNPINIPDAYRQPYQQKGIILDSPELQEEGGLNAQLYNSIYENNLYNGVLTAVEDFLKDTDRELHFYKIAGFHGLGILLDAILLTQSPSLKKLMEDLDYSETLKKWIKQIEQERIRGEIKQEAKQRKFKTALQEERKKRTEQEIAKQELETSLQEEQKKRTEQEIAKQELETSLQEEQKKLQKKIRQEKQLLKQHNLFKDKNNKLISIVEDFNNLIESILDTNRWKIGNTIYKLYRKIKGISLDIPPEEHQAKILQRLGRIKTDIAQSHSQLKHNEEQFDQDYCLEDTEKKISSIDKNIKLNSTFEYILSNLNHQSKITIIIPIFNGYEAVKLCLYSIVSHTTFQNAQLLLIDDASTDPRISSLLEEYSQLCNVVIIKNENNLGFVGSVNRGLQETKGDVVILNSDTEVTPRWLEKLSFAAHRNPKTATVTAISNNASAFSVPKVAQNNQIPLGLTKEEIGRLVTQKSQKLYPQTPTGHGFCMYVKREVIDEIGLLDIDNFPRGYGEENDFCMRAYKQGWNHIVDDTTIIFHQEAASFGDEKPSLVKTGRNKIDQLHPEYTKLVRQFLNSQKMQQVRDNISSLFNNLQKIQVKRRILFIIHEGSGGTIHTNLDLMEGLFNYYDPYLLTSNGLNLKLFEYNQSEGCLLIEEFNLDSKWVITNFTRSDYREIIFYILTNYQIELIHIRHLITHTFDLPQIASSLKIPVVLSFHDFYFCCPTVHLLDDKDQFCGGSCTSGQGKCRIPTKKLEGIPHLKHSWIYTWREQVEKMFSYIDAFVTTSESSKAIHLNSFPSLNNRLFQVIEHGRDLQQATNIATVPELNQPIKILIIGDLDIHKGMNVIASIKKVDTNKKLEFHFLGKLSQKLEKLGKYHGQYQRYELINKIRKIAPSFIGIFSIWPETYCHTLTEAWSAGVPVLASHIGTLKERINRHGGGWLIDYQNPKQAYQQILDIATNKQEYLKQLNRANIQGISTIMKMAKEYDYLYKRVISWRKSFQSSCSTSLYNTHILSIGVFLPGGPEKFPASSHIRVLNKLDHPSCQDKIHYSLLKAQEFIEINHLNKPFDIALVQRTAISSEQVHNFIQKCRNLGIPIVFEIDDNLFDLQGDQNLQNEYRQSITSIENLTRVANTVIVSTPELSRIVNQYNSKVQVIPNVINEKLWLTSLKYSIQKSEKQKRNQILKILYMGSITHNKDLEIIKKSIKTLRKKYNKAIQFYLVGGEKTDRSSDWYTKIEIPNECKNYPQFVHWLRQQQQKQKWDIAVAPLADTLLNRCKSYLKYLDYSALYLPGIYSRIQPYESVIKDGVNGLLVDNNCQSWCTAIETLYKNPTLRKTIQDNAYQDIIENHRCDLIVQTYLKTLYGALSQN